MSSWTSISPAEFGRICERLAGVWLSLKGYRILDRNLRVAGREVDILAMRGTTLVVCEVKARRHDRRGTALDAITPAKQRRLRDAGEMLLVSHPEATALRFDVITLDGVHFRHIRGAFDADS
jgi:putative endonuclease